MINSLINSVVDWIVVFATDALMPFMVVTFIVAVILRLIISFTVSRELWFSKEFEKRVNHFLEESDAKTDLSFFVTTKRLLEKTYYELFVVRSIMKRRKPDAVTSLTDRLFLIQHGCARTVRNTLNQTRFLKYGAHPPRLLEIAKNVLESNPCFNRALGVIPTGSFNEFLHTLTSLFIVGGIFGTFLGIMKALPELSGMNLNDIEGTKAVMDTFLIKVSFSMSTSIVGIILSVVLTMLNMFFSADRMYLSAVDRFEASLSLLWTRCSNNTMPVDVQQFDEHRDPMEALAEQALGEELAKKKPFIQKVA
ncbi:MAG TPA: hypothetical protein VE954_18720 [Oligoflexus sp.]|uniref:hypothetical protein n=1 Tax=Oligoflexus sp. TaxID=1971216 RepID=UPI002D40A622|nr:hypothetical protein [Oligoflexus sp.]HYX35135.1 hypothetical protein [Oligoflexus sp.]